MIGAGGGSFFFWLVKCFCFESSVDGVCWCSLSRRPGARRWIVAGAAPMRPGVREDPSTPAAAAPHLGQGSA